MSEERTKETVAPLFDWGTKVTYVQSHGGTLPATYLRPDGKLHWISVELRWRSEKRRVRADRIERSAV